MKRIADFAVKHRNWLLTAFVALALIVFVVIRRWPYVRPLEPNSEAATYVKEFYAHKFPVEVNEYDSPDGTAKIEDKYWFIFKCHTLWLKDGFGRSKIIRLGERSNDGTTWRHGWSKDSQAVFFRGYQHPNRCGDLPVGQIDLIHTRSDGISWQLPSNE